MTDSQLVKREVLAVILVLIIFITLITTITVLSMTSSLDKQLPTAKAVQEPSVALVIQEPEETKEDEIISDTSQ